MVSSMMRTFWTFRCVCAQWVHVADRWLVTSQWIVRKCHPLSHLPLRPAPAQPPPLPAPASCICCHERTRTDTSSPPEPIVCVRFTLAGVRSVGADSCARTGPTAAPSQSRVPSKSPALRPSVPPPPPLQHGLSPSPPPCLRRTVPPRGSRAQPSQTGVRPSGTRARGPSVSPPGGTARLLSVLNALPQAGGAVPVSIHRGGAPGWLPRVGSYVRSRCQPPMRVSAWTCVLISCGDTSGNVITGSSGRSRFYLGRSHQTACQWGRATCSPNSHDQVLRSLPVLAGARCCPCPGSWLLLQVCGGVAAV